MNGRIQFFIETFRGIGFGLTFGIYDKHIIWLGTFLCFNIYLEIKLK